MSENESAQMLPDQQEALSIRHSSLVCLALLSSGKWAVFTTIPLDRGSFRNEIRYFDSFPGTELEQICSSEREQRRIEDLEYEERREGLASSPAKTTVSAVSLEEMEL